MRKGDKIEKQAKEWLEKQYPDAFIEGPPVKTKFCRRDYFQLFDFIVAFQGGEMMGVQVSAKYLSQKDKEFKKAWKEWPGSKLYLHWKDGEWMLK